MMRTTIKKTGMLAILPLAAMLLSGCPWDVEKKNGNNTDPPTYLPQSSAANCLANLQKAYVERNHAEYVKLFADDYTFVVSPLDTGPDLPPDREWGFAEERDVHERMFNDERLDRITLSFRQATAVQSDDDFDGTWRARPTEIKLSVFLRTDESDFLELRVPNGHATFYFKEYPLEQASDGKSLWRIWRWEDEPIG